MSRPVPVPDATSAPYWEATSRGELAFAHCAHCDAIAHPPAPTCPSCGSTEPNYAFKPVDGSGELRSWTVIRSSFLPGFDDDVPFVLADVALDGTDDVRLIGRLLDGTSAILHIGARVTLAFERVGDHAVPAFELA